ncbi:hypothetical protein TcasGA2_TC033248 [Tribolium castaneum]|uniref:Uncharacterized protein n=1 Tax=Tribolium castaneum TaxID=7070 RepID=A0A139WHU6_TRICA|nr:hypothetical protein TcasGA2_TC033248 [Tribolium castaneum]
MCYAILRNRREIANVAGVQQYDRQRSTSEEVLARQRQ